MSFSYRAETRELNDEVRRLKDGSFVQLSDGFTHYELSNPSQGQTVVLVHGFSVPYFIYDPTFHFLSLNNFRVLRYDLLGRGYSDRPDTRYNIDLFVRQLENLLDALQLTGPVCLIGLSMGGPITATFTARHPQRVEKLILIDPAGAKPLFFSGLLKVATAPLVGEAFLTLVGSGGLVKNIASNFLDEKLDKHFLERYLDQTRYKGFRNAILSTIRNHVIDSCIDTYQKVGSMKKPVLLIWGRHDSTVPLSHSDVLRSAVPDVEFHIIEDSSHIPHYEKPDETNAILLEFLRKQCIKN